jgi:putative phosphoribosyl transferase
MTVHPLFRARAEAGRVLAELLKPVVTDGMLVLALPRGGVPVGFEISQILHAELDVFLVRKLGVPGQEELAIGAIASGGIRVLNEPLVRHLGIPPIVIDRITEREGKEIERRERSYRDGRAALAIANRRVILVDDGLATGASMLAAVRAVRAEQPMSIIVAVPIASGEASEELGRYADHVICAETPQPFYAVGAWYEDFSQTSDAEVQELLARGWSGQPINYRAGAKIAP